MEIITLQTKSTTYQMGVTKDGFLFHLYYGKKVDYDMSYLLTYYDRGFSGNPYDAGSDRTFSLDALPLEYPVYGIGDFRTPALNIQSAQGIYGCDLRYKEHSKKAGKYSIPALPAVYSEEAEASTVEILLDDTIAGISVILKYGILFDLDVITRSVVIKNIGTDEVTIDKAASASLDFLTGSYDILHFHGRHGMERILERTPVSHGISKYGSRRGTSSHQHNPFFILAEKKADEEQGSCYGMSFLYSGNFQCEVEQDQYNQTRWLLGMQEDMFSYPLKPTEEFHLPETAMAYSANGLTALSNIYHNLIRYHVCRGKYRDIRRPILINNWEATFLDFNGEKIIDIAKQAAKLGVEMLVLDDGWFGKRNSDSVGLGDWYVNEAKLNGTMAQLTEQINQLGMMFGLWIEPEMVSEDSQLFKDHPDWVFTLPNRKPVRSRNQLVLDFSRQEVVDYIFLQISKVIDAANIQYIKMDMNRSICDVYSAIESVQNYGKIMHQYVLGVYRFLEQLLDRYPDLLIEGCSGGGGRFDAGMLYYTPQIWCSDNTDAIERIYIQHGTSFGYPISAVGSHVSQSPNQQTGRVTSMKTRSIVAMAGTFGYELDLNFISVEEKEEVKKQILEYKKYWHLIHNGYYYRLHIFGTDMDMAAWNFVSQDKSEALLNAISLESHHNTPITYIKLKGLDETKQYRLEETGKVYAGAALMNAGIPIPVVLEEYHAWQMHFVEDL